MKLELPTGRVVELVAPRSVTPPRRAPGAPLFDEARALYRDVVAVRDDAGKAVSVDELALTDFHALRAIAAHEGWLDEEPVAVACVNCGAPMHVRPSHAMPLGPFLERALHDEELDERLEENVPHEIPPIALPGGARAEAIVLRSVTVREAAPLHAALAKEPFAIDAAVVRALGIVALGEEREPARIAEALSDADDEAFDAVARLFIELHYPLRLFGIAKCEACGARNDVDAPFERELGWTHERAGARDEPFVRFRAFTAKARAIARAIIATEHERDIAFVVEGGVAACDDGGIPLLGSYVPGAPGDAMHPSRGHEITVFYRTFRAMWDEEGAYDWEAELRETIEHEYEHFLAELRGGDPVDEEERREIAEEAIRIHGKSTLLRAEVRHLGGDFGDFVRRTWILWVILLAVVLLLTLGGR